jgi:carboxylate-amine ligase
MTRTVGVEEEFLLVQHRSPFLAAEGERVVAEAEATAPQEAEGNFDQEFMQQQAELGTAPHASIEDLLGDLRARRASLAEAARGRGVRLIPSATSPLDEDVTTTADERYERMTQIFGRVAMAQLACGMHVHVSIDSQEEGVAVLDRIRGWLPLLRALSANSPFLAGQDTEYASYRTVLWGQWPTAGIPDVFGSVEAYEQARAGLVASGAALDEAMICFDARLSARYPTVEIRACDVCADVEDAATIAALVRAMVSTAADEAASGLEAPPIRSELLRAATWRAARYGMEDKLVDPVTGALLPAWDLVDAFVVRLARALKDAGDDILVAEGLARIRARGTGARRQRDAHRDGGFGAVVDALAELA